MGINPGKEYGFTPLLGTPGVIDMGICQTATTKMRFS
jgi:hypothetical protein